MKNSRSVALLISLVIFPGFNSFAETPLWIWHNGPTAQKDDVCFLRKSFHLDTRLAEASLTVGVGGEATIYVNGRQVAQTSGYNKPLVKDITDDIKKGDNIIAVRAKSSAAADAGLLAVLELTINSRQSQFIVSDSSWMV